MLKEFFKVDYRGIVNILVDCPNLCAAIELEHVPHYTTLQKAADRLLKKTPRIASLIKRLSRRREDPQETLEAGARRRHRIRSPPHQPLLRTAKTKPTFQTWVADCGVQIASPPRITRRATRPGVGRGAAHRAVRRADHLRSSYLRNF
ncbi:MAG: hypothetical protein IH987_06795 [Planctomycetes bacterium]|nr:hypothetical protein [Planctomycetota bacterium]